jgi:hypothetical protein
VAIATFFEIYLMLRYRRLSGPKAPSLLVHLDNSRPIVRRGWHAREAELPRVAVPLTSLLAEIKEAQEAGTVTLRAGD